MKVSKLSNSAAYAAAAEVANDLRETACIPNEGRFLTEAGRAEAALKGGATTRGGGVSAKWNVSAIAEAAGLPKNELAVWAACWAMATARRTREAIDASKA